MTKSWMTPSLVRKSHVNWKLSDAIMRAFNVENDDFTGEYHVLWSRYVKLGYSTYTYELYCVINYGDSAEPDGSEKMAIIDKLQKFAFAFLDTNPMDDLCEEADEPYQRSHHS